MAVADDVGGAINSIKTTLDTARTGDGTLGKLMKDPALYNNLNDSAERLSKAISELQAFLEKLRKEGIPLKM